MRGKVGVSVNNEGQHPVNETEHVAFGAGVVARGNRCDQEPQGIIGALFFFARRAA